MAARRRDKASLILGIGAATAAAHIGNNFTTYLIGGLIDRYGFTPIQMGAWSMAESLSYAAAMFLLAPRAGSLSPRLLTIAASLCVAIAQAIGAATSAYPLLLGTRVLTGLGFGTANAAVNLAAGRTAHPARAISLGITVQTLLYAGINLVLPLVGRQFGVSGMFLALGLLTLLLSAGCLGLPGAAPDIRRPDGRAREVALTPDGVRVLVAMALFTFGSLAIWPFMERAAHAIGLSAIQFGRFQSIATVASAFGNLILAALIARLPRGRSLVGALLTCGVACAALTTIASPGVFAVALIVYNVSWFVTYPLLLGIGFAVEPSGRLAVLCSAVWLAMMSLGAFATGVLAQLLGGYAPAGLLGSIFCAAAAIAVWPLARRLDDGRVAPSVALPSTAG